MSTVATDHAAALASIIEANGAEVCSVGSVDAIPCYASAATEQADIDASNNRDPGITRSLLIPKGGPLQSLKEGDPVEFAGETWQIAFNGITQSAAHWSVVIERTNQP